MLVDADQENTGIYDIFRDYDYRNEGRAGAVDLERDDTLRRAALRRCRNKTRFRWEPGFNRDQSHSVFGKGTIDRCFS